METTELITQYIANLANDRSKLVGFYQQGSVITGLQDEYSDHDFIVIWDNEVPAKEERERVVKRLGAIAHEFKDLPAVKKSIEAFEKRKVIFNAAHVLSSDFFVFYKDIQRPNKFNPEMFIRLGGLKSSKIINDPAGRIAEYKNEIKVTSKIISLYKNYIKNEIEHDLKMLKVSTRRKGVANYLIYLSDLVENLNIMFSLSEKKFPGSLKWLEVTKNNELTGLLKDLEKRIKKEDTTKKFLKIAHGFGFRPSKNVKA